MTCLIEPSLPAASMPWRMIRTGCRCSAQSRSWRSVRRARPRSSSGPADALSQPNVSDGSTLARRTRAPGLTRSASPRSLERDGLMSWSFARVVVEGAHRMARRPRPQESPPMTATTGAKPHPIYLAGTWVESDDPLVVTNPADPENPAGSTFHATEAQYEQAVEAAVQAFE